MTLRKIISTLLLLLMLPASAIPAGLPELGDAADAIVSEVQERAIGKRIMVDIRADHAYIDDAEIADYINALGNKLVATSADTLNENRPSFEFFVLNDEAINAFALLGGFVAVHSGLLLSTNNESELAGVVGHEITHVVQRHQARGAESQKNAGWIQLATLIAAVVAAQSNSSSGAQAAEAALTTSAALSYQSQLDYSREFEREADRFGLTRMDRAGFDANGMVSFFERLQRATRFNDGKTPGYLRTHPLTTDRIADMQDRVRTMSPHSAIDSLDYRLAKAKLRVISMGSIEAAKYFRAAIDETTVLRNQADVYGLALALKQNRDYVGAEKALASLTLPNAWVMLLSAQIKADQRLWKESLLRYQNALKRYPERRALYYGYIDTLYEAKSIDEGLAASNERLRNTPGDAHLHDLAAKGYAFKNKQLAQHRATAEAYYLRDNLKGAIEQLEIGLKAKDGDFYELSSADSRLRTLRAELKNHVPLPGEPKEKDADK